MKVEESIVINRSPEEVFAFLAVRRNDPVWMAAVVESEWLEPAAGDRDAPLEIGRRGRMVMKNIGGRRGGDGLRAGLEDRASNGRGPDSAQNGLPHRTGG